MDDEQGQSGEWWVETLLGSARRTNGVAEKSNGVTQSLIAEAGKKLGDVCELLLKAHATSMGTGTAIEDTKQALKGTSYYWNKVMPMVRQHRRTIAGATFSACSVVAFAIVTFPSPVQAVTVEQNVEKGSVECLLKGKDYQTAWVTACQLSDGPEKWFWQGEVKRAMGDEPSARLFYQRAATQGHRHSILAARSQGHLQGVAASSP